MNNITNYQEITEKTLSEFKDKKTILLHSCCGPCSTYVTDYLSKYFDIFLYYYNPNIYPEEEYIKRLKTQKEYLERIQYAHLVESDYKHSVFLDFIKGYEDEPEGGKRCVRCFELRLERTAIKARELGIEYFGTTLTVSPHKNAIIINETGKKLEEKYNVKFLLSDFKKKDGYKKSIDFSKQYNLYRQRKLNHLKYG